MSDHLSAVQGIYAAFGRGDVPAMLEPLAEDIRWEDWGDHFAQRAGIPMFTPRSGHAGVMEFFAFVGQCEVLAFDVRDFLVSERQVVADVLIDIRLPNGGRYRDEELHLWTFDDQGKIARLRHYVDTAKHIAAAGGQDTTVSQATPAQV